MFYLCVRGTVLSPCKHFHLVLTIVPIVDNYPILQMWKLRLRKWIAQVTKHWHTAQICGVLRSNQATLCTQQSYEEDTETQVKQPARSYLDLRYWGPVEPKSWEPVLRELNGGILAGQRGDAETMWLASPYPQPAGEGNCAGLGGPEGRLDV